MNTMAHARQQHRREFLEPVRDSKKGGHPKKDKEYVPFRAWARANAKRFPNPSPKLVKVLRGPS